MKVSKWVDMGQEVEVNISYEDIRVALNEAFDDALRDPIGEPYGVYQIQLAMNQIGAFLNALEEKHIALMQAAPRKLIADYMRKAADRFYIASAPSNASS